jgi:hypothetical protein
MATYKTVSTSENVILFAFLSQGSMVIGNLNAVVSTDVDFWGSQCAIWGRVQDSPPDSSMDEGRSARSL